MATLAPTKETITRVHPLDDAPLTADQRRIMERLDRFEAPFLEEKLLADGKFGSQAEYREAFVEFKKYAALGQIVDGPLGMASKEVDEVWHQFILFTREYLEFCEECLGWYLHHSPHTSTTPNSTKRNGARNFARAYKQVFGDIPAIWQAISDCGSDCAGCGNDCSKCSSTCK